MTTKKTQSPRSRVNPESKYTRGQYFSHRIANAKNTNFNHFIVLSHAQLYPEILTNNHLPLFIRGPEVARPLSNMNSELLFPIPRIAQQQIKIKKCYSYNPSYYFFMLFFASGFTTTIQQDCSSFACQQSAPRPVRQTDIHSQFNRPPRRMSHRETEAQIFLLSFPFPESLVFSTTVQMSCASYGDARWSTRRRALFLIIPTTANDQPDPSESFVVIIYSVSHRLFQPQQRLKFYCASLLIMWIIPDPSCRF